MYERCVQNQILFPVQNISATFKLNSKPEGTKTPPHRTPFIVGFGGSGVVQSTGGDEQTSVLLNKKVAFIADPAQDGSYAQYIKCDRRIITVLPDDVPFHEAACVPVAGCTAFESLAKVGLTITSDEPLEDAGEGKRLLIVGGAGGVGSWIVQLARSNCPKLEIVCTVGSEESAKWCKKMGCNRTINHGEIDSLGRGPKGSCDYIICLAEPTEMLFNSLTEVLRPYGNICLVVAGDSINQLDLSFVFFKCGTVSTQTVFSSIRDGYRLDQAHEMSTILDLMKTKKVNAPISDAWNDAESDWERCNKVGGYIDLVGAGHTKGKLVMKIGD